MDTKCYTCYYYICTTCDKKCMLCYRIICDECDKLVCKMCKNYVCDDCIHIHDDITINHQIMKCTGCDIILCNDCQNNLDRFIIKCYSTTDDECNCGYCRIYGKIEDSICICNCKCHDDTDDKQNFML
jgi:hypothetical protein